MKILCGYISPCSLAQKKTRIQFHYVLTNSQKFLTCIATAFAGLLSLPLFIIGGVFSGAAVFRAVVEKFAFSNRSTKVTNALANRMFHKGYPSFYALYECLFKSEPISYWGVAAFAKELLERNLDISKPIAYDNFLTDLLMMAYLREEHGAWLIEKNGRAASFATEIKGKIAFTRYIDFLSEDYDYGKSLEEVLNEYTKLLSREIAAHPNKRPSKIITQCLLGQDRFDRHWVPLIIEPDPNIKKKANITIINNHGKVSRFSDMENKLLNAVKKVYNHKGTKTLRNPLLTSKGPFCYIDCIENIRYLASYSDVQKHIEKNRLVSRDPLQILEKRKEHKKMLARIYVTAQAFEDCHEKPPGYDDDWG